MVRSMTIEHDTPKKRGLLKSIVWAIVTELVIALLIIFAIATLARGADVPPQVADRSVGVPPQAPSRSGDVPPQAPTRISSGKLEGLAKTDPYMSARIKAAVNNLKRQTHKQTYDTYEATRYTLRRPYHKDGDKALWTVLEDENGEYDNQTEAWQEAIRRNNNVRKSAKSCRCSGECECGCNQSYECDCQSRSKRKRKSVAPTYEGIGSVPSVRLTWPIGQIHSVRASGCMVSPTPYTYHSSYYLQPTIGVNQFSTSVNEYWRYNAAVYQPMTGVRSFSGRVGSC